MGSGKTISLAGPGIIFIYALTGLMLYFVMRAMGELLLHDLTYKTFIDFCEDILGPSAGFLLDGPIGSHGLSLQSPKLLLSLAIFHFGGPNSLTGFLRWE